MSNHFRVVIRVEQLDGEGNCEEVVSEDVLGDFPEDEDDISVGQKSNDFYEEVVKAFS